MAATIREIMNHELFHLHPDDRAGPARVGILGMDITAAPVLDRERRPIGVASLRDLMGADEEVPVSVRMSSPPVVVRAGASIRDGARIIGETGLRHLVVVEDDGRASGMVSAVDVVRGLLGLPTRHPATFPHLDPRTGLSWTDDARLDEEWIEMAPDGPGLLVLTRDVPDRPRLIVWAEWTHNVRTRLLDLLSLPQEHPELTRWLERMNELTFRSTPLEDPGAAAVFLEEQRRRHLPPPSPRVVVSG